MAETGKKSEKRKRTEYIRARVSSEEKKVFVDLCSSYGLSAGDFIRKKCCNAKPLRQVHNHNDNQKIPAHLIGLVLQNQNRMARLDNNVNQMAKAINIARLNCSRTDMIAILNRHEQTLLHLISLYQAYLETSNECRDLLRQSLKK